MASEGYVDFRGQRTWYRVAGDLQAPRPPLLALHGGPGSTHHYFAPLEELADERAVVVYDQLGCGRSDRPDGIDWDVGDRPGGKLQGLRRHGLESART